ncbi:transcriptional regulator [Longimycelium tulufanense]|uniref:Transcriptional regulator n=1 Tax=Longimycelium tulufanense TaxID=907463 RepID=A0A8J3CGI3_9PSEU|nr:helix-turn-helix domain-containing protein [Longimycelium tulufanense]GGM65441.1 transcriptional regulator [Longimycelium tulufanense]
MERTLPQPKPEDLDLVSVLNALADPVRLRLVGRMAHGEPCGCGPAENGVDVSASTLSHHWRVLREAGVTRTLVSGRRRWVELRREDLDARFPGLIDAVVTAAGRR